MKRPIKIILESFKNLPRFFFFLQNCLLQIQKLFFLYFKVGNNCTVWCGHVIAFGMGGGILSTGVQNYNTDHIVQINIRNAHKQTKMIP